MEYDYNKTSFEEEHTKHRSFSLFVPLYLVILAFFILLNSISEENQKKQDQAITSIEKSFSSDTGTGRTNIKNKALFFSFSQIVTTYFDDIEKELKSSYKQDEFIVERKGYKMRIKIPIRKIFEESSSNIIAFENRLFNRIIKTISLERQGVTVSINIKMDSQGFSLLGDKSPFEIDAERTKNIVKKFIENGISRNNISAGIALNDSQYLLIETKVQKSNSFLGGALEK